MTTGEALRVLVVDDEPLAGTDLAWLLRARADIASVEIVTSATDALRLLDSATFDAIFTDVRMPGFSGLDLARVLARFEHGPAVVFVSAYEDHAVEAFEVAAVDYLLKPIVPERLADSVARVGRHLAAASAEPVQQPVAEAEQPSNDLDTIFCEVAGVMRKVTRAEIAYVEASRDFVRIHTAHGSHLVRLAISNLDAAWESHGWVRLHRSFLAPLDRISELRVGPDGGWVARVGDRHLPVSRRHLPTVRSRLQRNQRLMRLRTS
jgi:two-component system, LytTR family, response regulator LytT